MENISEQIAILAEKLKVPAEQLMNYAISGIRVEGMIGLFAKSLLFVAGIYIFVKLKKWLSENDNWDHPAAMGLVIIILPIIAICAAYSDFVKIFAPQYWIIKQLLNL